MTIQKPTILVIDDEAINIRIMGEILSHDYRVIHAMHGEEGIRLAYEAVPDLILLDVKMSGMDGYQVCEHLMKDPRTAAISVIFVTALDSTVQEVQGLAAGAIDYITKPFRPEVVKARIRNHLDFKRKIQQPHLHVPTIDAGEQGVSVRQRQILEWIQAGKTNKEIAMIIGSSEANVKYHLKKMMDRLNTHNRAQLIAKAVNLGIIQPEN